MTHIEVLANLDRASPFILTLIAHALGRHRPSWRTITWQQAGLATVTLAGPLVHGTRIDAATLALWPGVCLAGALAASQRRWGLTFLAYIFSAFVCAACYTRSWWWLGEWLEFTLRVAVGPTLAWSWPRRLTPARVAALAPAIEIAFAPLGPWARWGLGRAALMEDWSLGLVGSAVAYAVVLGAAIIDLRRRP